MWNSVLAVVFVCESLFMDVATENTRDIFGAYMKQNKNNT